MKELADIVRTLLVVKRSRGHTVTVDAFRCRFSVEHWLTGRQLQTFSRADFHNAPRALQ